MLRLAIAAARAERRSRKRREEAERRAEERARQRAEENQRIVDETRRRRVEAYVKERQARAAERAAIEADRQRREREAAEKEAARLREKYTPVPDQRMIDLFARVDALGLPPDIVTKFKQLGGNTQRALAETFGAELKDALPLYLKIDPEVRPLALKWAKAGSLLDRLRACLPIEDR